MLCGVACVAQHSVVFAVHNCGVSRKDDGMDRGTRSNKMLCFAHAELLKTTDDSLSAFPRVWRQGDAAPNTAHLAEEDVTKAAPTAKRLGAYPSQNITLVSPRLRNITVRTPQKFDHVTRTPLPQHCAPRSRRCHKSGADGQEAGRLPQPGYYLGETPEALPFCTHDKHPVGRLR